MKRIFGVDVGLLILSLAFIFSFFGGLNVTLDLGDRLVGILQANTNQYWNYVRDALLYLVLPPAIGLLFSIIGYVNEVKSPSGILDVYWLHLTVFGVFFSFLGVYGVYWTYGEYVLDISLARNVFHSVEIASLVTNIYLYVWLSNAFWIIAGILFVTSTIFRILPQIKTKRDERRDGIGVSHTLSY